MVMMRAVPAATVKSGHRNGTPSVKRHSVGALARQNRLRNVEHVPEWRAPAPIWDRALSDSDAAALFRPIVLRFDRDEFMDDLLALLERSPERLPEYVAQPETWRDERAGWLPSNDVRWSQMAYKLFQPAHKRYYLVAADLVCRIPGLPCRTIDPAKEESASFVLRRLAPKNAQGEVDPADPATYVEEAWAGSELGWRPLADAGRLGSFDGSSEERHPLFGVFFDMDGQKRRVLAGLIPVSSRESYEAKGSASPYVDPGSVPGEVDPRIAQFESRVERSLRNLLRASTSEAEAAEASTFILYDLAELLHDHFAPVWAIVESDWNSGGLESPSGPVELLADRLLTERIGVSETTWAEALVAVWNDREALLAGDPNAESFTIDPSVVTKGKIDALRGQFEAVVPTLGPYEPPPDPSGASSVPTLPMMDADAGAHYVIRCVYERPHCMDLHPPLVSEASRPFQIASFFDPDAPTRPVRISLPIDTSVSGLRKFKRDVSFFASKQLRSQMERLRGLNFSELEEGPGPGRSFDLGMVCTLSIPIITICAMILLLIILQALNFVFWWLPFCKICFPIRR